MRRRAFLQPNPDPHSANTDPAKHSCNVPPANGAQCTDAAGLLAFPKRGSGGSSGMSRRHFLAGSAALAALAAVGASCADEHENASCVPASGEALALPDGTAPPPEDPDSPFLRFFTAEEARSADALVARLLPGTPEDPGAHEAGVVFYIDHLLSTPGGFGQGTYRHAPFAQAYDGASPPANAAQERQVVRVSKTDLPRYGYQSALTFCDIWRLGLASLDQLAGVPGGFAILSPSEQDAIIAQLEAGTAPVFTQPSAKDFFHLARQHTIEGMFCDPGYGGNRGMVGWKLIGYPGAQRAYLPSELQTGTTRAPQSLAQMAHFHAGVPTTGAAILPVSGTCLVHDLHA